MSGRGGEGATHWYQVVRLSGRGGGYTLVPGCQVVGRGGATHWYPVVRLSEGRGEEGREGGLWVIAITKVVTTVLGLLNSEVTMAI